MTGTKPDLTKFVIDDHAGGKINVSLSREVIDYVEPARSFGQADLADAGAHGRYQPRMIAFPDRRSGIVSPAMLTLGSDQRLSLVRRGTDNSSAWARIGIDAALAEHVGGTLRVSAFGCAYTDDDRIALVVAADAGPGTRASRVFVAWDLSSSSDWGCIDWVDCGTRQDGAHIAGIRVLREGEVWSAFLSSELGPKASMLLLRSDRPADFEKAIVFSPAVDLKEVLSFTAGMLDEDRVGLHILATSVSGDRVLTTRRVPRFDAAGRITGSYPAYVFKCPGGANVIQTGAIRPDGADIYVAGDGIRRIASGDFDDQDGATQDEVMPGGGAPFVRMAVAENAARDVTVWALRSDNTLWVTMRKGGTPWRPALQIRSGVRDMVAIAGAGSVAASVLLIHADGSATRLWRDAGENGLWQENELTVADSEDVVRTTAFGSTVRLVEADDTPLAATDVLLSASSPTYVVVNGASLLIGPGTDAAVRTRPDGRLSIYSRAQSLTPPILRVRVPDRLCFDFMPSGSALSRLHGMSANDLAAAKVGDAPLVPDTFRTGPGRAELESVSKMIRQVAGLGLGDGPIPGVRLSMPGESYAMIAKPAANDGCLLAIRANPSGIALLGEAEAGKIASETAADKGFFEGVGDTLSDFFNSDMFRNIGGAIEKGVSFVIRAARDGWEFVCSVAGHVKRWAITAYEAVGEFLGWAWSGIKVAAEKVWDYLKFLFDWDDILFVRDVIKRGVRDNLIEMKNRLAEWRGTVSAQFDTLLEIISDEGARRGVRRDRRIGTFLSERQPSIRADMPADNADIAGSIQEGSVFSWITETISNAMNEVISIEIPPEFASNPTDAFESLMADVWDQFEQAYAVFKDDMKDLFGDKAPSITDISFDFIKRIAVTLGVRFAQMLVAALKRLAQLLMDIAQTFLDAAGAMLFAKVRLPFLEKAIKLLSGKSVDTSFQLADILALPAAIPACIAFKLITGESPQHAVSSPTITPQSGNGVVATLYDYKTPLVTLGGAGWAVISNVLDGLKSLKPAKGDMMSANTLPASRYVRDGGYQMAGWQWISIVGSIGFVAYTDIPANTRMWGKSGAANVACIVATVISVAQCAAGYRTTRRAGRETDVDLAGMLKVDMKLTDGILATIKMIARGTAYAANSDAWNGRDCAIYMTQTSAKAATCFAPSIKNPKAKGVVLGVAGASTLTGFGLACWKAHDQYAAVRDAKARPRT